MTKMNPTEENFKKVDELLTKFFKDRDERVQAEGEIQKTIDYEVVKGVLDSLPNDGERDEFMAKFTENSDDGEAVSKYLKEKGITKQVEEVFLRVSQKLVEDLETQLHDETKKELAVSEPLVGKEPVK